MAERREIPPNSIARHWAKGKNAEMVRQWAAEGLNNIQIDAKIGVHKGSVSMWRRKYFGFNNLFPEKCAKSTPAKARQPRKTPKKKPVTEKPMVSRIAEMKAKLLAKSESVARCERCCWKRRIGQERLFCLWPTCIRDKEEAGKSEPSSID